jgi:hypothetical protein
MQEIELVGIINYNEYEYRNHGELQILYYTQTL